MYIKSLVIDGFKSYGNRVELKDFDPGFNAITGLNGTGKSNILDAICFALGISCMNTIRASTLEDVIYKNGQAGILKASVTIYFDNKDKTRSPPNYEHYDEIVIMREVGIGIALRNIFKINNVIVPAKRVMDFYKSLNMNVNNPHFIIMQGKITKVLHMKPIEILLMIEEASGTNIYESKRRTLAFTVDKKDNKLKEVHNFANDEILPTMDIIVEEKRMLEEFNSVQSQLKIQKNMLENWNYIKSIEIVRKVTEEHQIVQNLYRSKQDSHVDFLNKIKMIEMELHKTENTLKNVTEKKLVELQVMIDKAEKDKIAAQFKVNAFKKDISNEDMKIKNIEKQINITRRDFEQIKKEMADFMDKNAGLDEENKKNTKLLEDIDNKIRSLNSGNIFSDEDNGSVQENINKFQLELQNQQIENKRYEIKIEGLKHKLDDNLIGLREAQQAYDTEMAQLADKEKEYEKVKKEYLKANEEISKYNGLMSSLNDLLRNMHGLNSQIESFEFDNPLLFFQYNNPYPNFDQRKVHGRFCRLFSPIDFRFELALTTLAGGKLYYIVVEDDTVGKDLLETNKFPSRMNFIPLNIIKSESLPPNIVSVAQQIGGADNVFPAMSLIKYDKKHIKAIEWVFGHTFICTTKEIAEKVCFDSRVNKQCFTLDGDHFHPSGSLTGGANFQKPIFQALASHGQIVSKLQEEKSKYEQINNDLTEMTGIPKKFAQLQEQKFIVQMELERIRSFLNFSQSYQQITEVNNIKQQTADLEENLAKGKINENKLQIKMNVLELKMKNVKSILKQQISDANKTRKNIAAKLKNNKGEYDKKQNNYYKLDLQLKDFSNQLQKEENELAEILTEKGRFEKDLITFIAEFDKANSIYMKVFNEYECQKQEVLEKTNEYEDLLKEHKSAIEGAEFIKVNLLELDAALKKKISELDNIQKIFNKYDETMTDGQKEVIMETDYTNFNSVECKKSLNDLQNKYNNLLVKINSDKLISFDKHVNEFDYMPKKVSKVANDVTKMSQLIDMLEIKKCEHLKEASDRVNVEFEKIFNTLLPGAQACLRQVNPDDITAGLEICVGFNGLWKDSLDELSGGQRSLVALSLVLAMLLFNPGPLYILDEVDAALDISHTQNISNMLKQHFKKSQFIVVSLKGGMFANANVLFNTTFSGGCSVVTRTTCDHS